MGIAKPDHSPAGAFLAIGVLRHVLAGIAPAARGQVIASCVAAVLAHHGGWLGSQAGQRQDIAMQRLHALGAQAIVETFGRQTWQTVSTLPTQDRLGALKGVLDLAMGPESLRTYWPLVAYLTRTLRLSDQAATKEGGKSE